MSDLSVRPHARLARSTARLAGLALTVAVGVPIALPAIVGAEGTVMSSPRGAGASSGALLVRLRADVGTTEGNQVLAAAGASQIGSLSSLSVRVVDVPLMRRWSAMRSLAADPRVESVEADAVANTTVEPNDPSWGRQWGPRKVRAPKAWSATTGARETIIAIVDTGVDADQPDLRGRVMQGWDFQNNDKKPRDDNGHGTAVAGVAAAAGNDRIGIAGFCWNCRILPVKVLNANGSGSHSNIAAGIVWAAQQGADVINLSLASANNTNVMADAVAYARRKGAVVVAAAGNEGSPRKFYPAAYPGVISVAATNGRDRLYSWSNRGTWIKLAAPGCAYTTKRGRNWSWWCGTSFASPAVAGTVALMHSLAPKLSRSRLERMVLGNTDPGSALRMMSGRLDTYRAVQSAQRLAEQPETPPPPTTP